MTKLLYKYDKQFRRKLITGNYKDSLFFSCHVTLITLANNIFMP